MRIPDDLLKPLVDVLDVIDLHERFCVLRIYLMQNFNPVVRHSDLRFVSVAANKRIDIAVVPN